MGHGHTSASLFCQQPACFMGYNTGLLCLHDCFLKEKKNLPVEGLPWWSKWLRSAFPLQYLVGKDPSCSVVCKNKTKQNKLEIDGLIDRARCYKANIKKC